MLKSFLTSFPTQCCSEISNSRKWQSVPWLVTHLSGIWRHSRIWTTSKKKNRSLTSTYGWQHVLVVALDLNFNTHTKRHPVFFFRCRISRLNSKFLFAFLDANNLMILFWKICQCTGKDLRNENALENVQMQSIDSAMFS